MRKTENSRVGYMQQRAPRNAGRNNRMKTGILIFSTILLCTGCGWKENPVKDPKESTTESSVGPQLEQSSEQETESASEPVTEQQTEPTGESEPTEETEPTEEPEPTGEPVLTEEYELIYEGVSVFNPGTVGTYFKYKNICADLYRRRLQEDTGEYIELSLWYDQKKIWHTEDQKPADDSNFAKDDYLFWQEDSEHPASDRRLCYYVIPMDGDVYLMRYSVETASNTVTMSYKVFGIYSMIDSPDYYQGGEIPVDAGSITVYLMADSDVDRDVSFPVDEMAAFADTVKGCMENGYLAVSTLRGAFESGDSADRDNPVSPYLYDIFPWIPEMAAQHDISTEGIHSTKKLLTAIQKALPADTSVTMPDVSADGKYFITGDYYSDSDESYLTVRRNEDGSYGGTLLINRRLYIQYAGHCDNGILTAARISDYPDDPSYELEISFKGGRATVTLTAAYEEGDIKAGDTFTFDRNQKPMEFEYLKNAEEIPRE